MNTLSKQAENIQNVLKQLNINTQVVELPDSTRTALEASAAIGCSVAQIAKSLIFRGKTTNAPVLVITSGSNRVDESLLQTTVGEPIEIADPAFVRTYTGYAIGGIPPIGHQTKIDKIYMDVDLTKLPLLWAAAGTPHAVFSITPQQLLSATDAAVIRVKV